MRLFRSVLARSLGTIVRVRTSQPLVALTFDDGPHGQFTPQLLDLLQKYQAKATFFILGANAKDHPQVLARIKNEGHALGCHSWNHPSFPTISWQARREQIEKWRDGVGHDTNLFRPPYGHQSVSSYLTARLMGYKVIGWSVVAVDWLDHDENRLYHKLLGEIKAGDIVLLHDNLFDCLNPGYLDREPIFSALDRLLASLSGKYQFVTVPELLQAGRPARRLEFREADAEMLSRLKQSQATEVDSST